MAKNMIKTIMGEMTYREYGELIDALAKKPYLTSKEASTFFGIGINRIYLIVNEPDCDFKIDVSGKPTKTKYLIDREKMAAYLGRG